MCARFLFACLLLCVLCLTACVQPSATIVTPGGWASPISPTSTIISTTVATPTAVPLVLAVGRFVFTSAREDYQTSLSTVNADGSDLKELLYQTRVVGYPRWSPDGKWITFNIAGDRVDDIALFRSDGTSIITLTTSSMEGCCAEWLPDGQRLIFTGFEKGENSEIFSIKPDGTNLVNLTHNPARDGAFVLSPDGQYIAFQATTDGTDVLQGSEGKIDLYVMKSNGEDRLRLTTGIRLYYPNWSPDSTRIAFTGWTDANQRDVYLVNRDGTGLINLTQNAADDVNPVWSPDGTQIAFSSEREKPYSVLYVMKPDGSEVKRISPLEEGVVFAQWDTEGKRLAYASSSPSSYSLYISSADGTRRQFVAELHSGDFSPQVDWYSK